MVITAGTMQLAVSIRPEHITHPYVVVKQFGFSVFWVIIMIFCLGCMLYWISGKGLFLFLVELVDITVGQLMSEKL